MLVHPLYSDGCSVGSFIKDLAMLHSRCSVLVWRINSIQGSKKMFEKEGEKLGHDYECMDFSSVTMRTQALKIEAQVSYRQNMSGVLSYVCNWE